jgi:hypothetical protein
LNHYHINSEATQFITNLSTQVPLWVNKLRVLSYYTFVPRHGSGIPCLADNYKMSLTEAIGIIRHLISVITESVVVLEGVWFLFTSMDAFLHKNTDVDDCADLSKISYQPIPNGFLRRNSRFKHDYFEVSIKFGEVELLATGGFLGGGGGAHVPKINPFLVTSVLDLPNDLTGKIETPSSVLVYTRKDPIDMNAVITSNRIINQYLKNRCWKTLEIYIEAISR